MEHRCPHDAGGNSRSFSGDDGALDFKWASGAELPSDFSDYKLIVHCGACMINRKEMLHRIMTAEEAGVPMVNYGVLIAHVLGILPRALQPFPRSGTYSKRADEQSALSERVERRGSEE